MKSIIINCKNLVSLTIPSTVTEIPSNPFLGCSSLTNVTVNTPEFIFEDGVLFNNDKTILVGCLPSKSGQYSILDGVIDIGENAFLGCIELTSVTIPETVQTIGVCAFNGCEGLKTISLPDSIGKLDAQAFYDCKGLETIIIPASVTEMNGDVFGGCDNLKTIIFEGNAPENSWGIGLLGLYGNVTVYYSGEGFDKYIKEYKDYPSIEWIRQ